MSEQVEPLDGNLFGPDQPCFGCGPRHPTGFRLAFTREGDEVVTFMTPGPDHQGPPGIMHGGLVATLADEVAAWALLGGPGKFGFTVHFEARYRRAIRIGIPVEARARITSPLRRLVDVEARLLQEGEEAFTGAFRFALLDRRSADRLLGGPIPEEWLRFTR